jgi:type VI secretion system protein ImpM
MGNALFGKLPARRDFISVGVPRTFLEVWEPWMQAGLAASQQTLDADWPAAYTQAPVWRFWLGRGLCATAVLGAFIPSQDGIGRAYPLTVLTTGDLAPPDCDGRETWFEAVEAFLAGTLDHMRDHAATLQALDTLPIAASGWPAADLDIADVLGGRVVSDDTLAAGLCARLVADPRCKDRDGSSYWWTDGNSVCRRSALAVVGLPDPSLFATMLTGAWPKSRSQG